MTVCVCVCAAARHRLSRCPPPQSCLECSTTFSDQVEHSGNVKRSADAQLGAHFKKAKHWSGTVTRLRACVIPFGTGTKRTDLTDGLINQLASPSSSSAAASSASASASASSAASSSASSSVSASSSASSSAPLPAAAINYIKEGHFRIQLKEKHLAWYNIKDAVNNFNALLELEGACAASAGSGVAALFRSVKTRLLAFGVLDRVEVVVTRGECECAGVACCLAVCARDGACVRVRRATSTNVSSHSCVRWHACTRERTHNRPLAWAHRRAHSHACE